MTSLIENFIPLLFSGKQTGYHDHSIGAGVMYPFYEFGLLANRSSESARCSNGNRAIGHLYYMFYTFQSLIWLQLIHFARKAIGKKPHGARFQIKFGQLR